MLPVGGAHITLDLVTGLEAPMAQCEQIKRGYVFNTIHNIVAGVPAENLLAMYDEAKK